MKHDGRPQSRNRFQAERTIDSIELARQDNLRLHDASELLESCVAPVR